MLIRLRLPKIWGVRLPQNLSSQTTQNLGGISSIILFIIITLFIILLEV
jgi:hypothetical protein